eukprot:Awhi_evm1s7721
MASISAVLDLYVDTNDLQNAKLFFDDLILHNTPVSDKAIISFVSLFAPVVPDDMLGMIRLSPLFQESNKYLINCKSVRRECLFAVFDSLACHPEKNYVRHSFALLCV